jgi:hypothetical protein
MWTTTTAKSNCSVAMSSLSLCRSTADESATEERRRLPVGDRRYQGRYFAVVVDVV